MAGPLTQQYLDDHLKTLPKLVKPRIEEWVKYSDVTKWKVDIIFIAHSITAKQPEEIVDNGVTFKIHFSTYESFIKGLTEYPKGANIDTFVLKPLAEKRTPSFVRQKLNELIA